jgi:hypothetical protein
VYSTEYPRRTSGAKILNDIRAFFETGAEPVVSDVSKFHERYSLNDEGSEPSVKDQIRAAQDELNEMRPVATISGISRGNKSAAQFKNEIIEKAKDYPENIDVQNVGEVAFGQKEIAAAMNYERSNAEIAALLLVPHVLKRGINITDRTNHKGRGFQTITIAAPVVINNKPGNMGVVIKRTKGLRYKAHRILAPDGSTFVLSEIKSDEGTGIQITRDNANKSVEFSPSDNPTVTSPNEIVKGENNGAQRESLSPGEETAENSNLQRALDMIKSGSANSEVFNETGLAVMANGNIRDVESGEIIYRSEDDGLGSRATGNEMDGRGIQRERKTVQNGGRNTGAAGGAQEGVRAAWGSLGKEQRNEITDIVREYTRDPSAELRDMLTKNGYSVEEFAEQIYEDYQKGRAVAERWAAFVPEISEMLNEFDGAVNGGERYSLETDDELDEELAYDEQPEKVRKLQC